MSTQTERKKAFLDWIKNKAAEADLLNFTNIDQRILNTIDKMNSASYDERTGSAEIVCEVTGTQYEGRSQRIESVRKGTALSLKREPQNTYNANNVMVLNAMGQSLGNLPADLANVLSPLWDAKEAEIKNVQAYKVEPLSARPPRSKKANLYVSFTVELKKVSYSAKSGSIVCILGGDQTRTWAQELRVLHCRMSLADAKAVFEIYNRKNNEYDPGNNSGGYFGLDNLAEEVRAARAKMRSEKKPGLNYSEGDEPSYTDLLSYAEELAEKEPGRYGGVIHYFRGVGDPHWLDLQKIFKADAVGEEDYYWLEQTPVSAGEYNAEADGFSHWYEVAELFPEGPLPFDLQDPDTVSIFGTGKFEAFADLSYGC